MPVKSVTNVTTKKVVTLELGKADLLEFARNKWPHLFDGNRALIDVFFREHRGCNNHEIDSDNPVVVTIETTKNETSEE